MFDANQLWGGSIPSKADASKAGSSSTFGWLQPCIIEKKFRSQASDNMDRWKSRGGKSQRREEKRREEEEEEKESEEIVRRNSQKKEDAGARKDKNVAKHCVVQKICGSGGSKSRLAKAAGAEPSGQMRDELYAVAARSTFPSQNVQNTSCLDHFWKLRFRQSERRCGAKHVSKSKRTKHNNVGALLEVEMSKKCAPLWREARVQVKMYKTHHSRTTFGS